MHGCTSEEVQSHALRIAMVDDIERRSRNNGAKLPGWPERPRVAANTT
jgi:hypothetical protein